MSVNNIQADVQNLEQYKIRKQTEAKQAEELQAQAQQPVQEIPKVDEYDKANPVGKEVEGIYSVSHDNDGNLKIDYKQPVSKAEDSSSEEKKEAMQTKSGEKSEASNGGSAPTATSKTDESSDSEDDDELERLKKQRDTIKRQLSSASDEETKAALRAQLQAIEMQIAMKSSQTD